MDVNTGYVRNLISSKLLNTGKNCNVCGIRRSGFSNNHHHQLLQLFSRLQKSPFRRNLILSIRMQNAAPHAHRARLSYHLHTVEFDIGVVGPPALGRQVQTAWHKFVDAPEPQGWDNQIRTEPGILLTYLHKRRYGEISGVQLVPHIGASLGTVATFARAGALLRAGQNMTGFGPDGIEPGGAGWLTACTVMVAAPARPSGSARPSG